VSGVYLALLNYQSEEGFSLARSQATVARARLFFVLAVFLGVLPLVLQDRLFVITATATSATFLLLSGALWLRSTKQRAKQGSNLDAITTFIAKDTIPSFVTSTDGEIYTCNPAAGAQFDLNTGQTLAGVLKSSFANPAGILFRLQSRANATGSAREEIVTRSGQMRLSVHQINNESFIWRIEPIVEPAGTRNAQDSHSLPMIMAGRTDVILFMNEAARRLIGSRVKSLDRVFLSVPVASGTVCTITTSGGPQQSFVTEISAGAGRRALYLLPTQDEQPEPQQWQAFLDLPVPMIKIAPDGSVQAFNRMASKLVGVSLQQNTHLSELMEGLGRSISDWLNDTLADRLVQKSEFLRLKRADVEVFVQVVLNRIKEEGEPALIAVMHDATELKSLEAKFVQSQKMQAIGQLAGGVAHDFNNLLTAISGHCDLLLLRHDQGDTDYADLMQINQNANRAAALVGQLLAFSRKQTLRPETLDMRDTLSDLTHLLNRLVGEKVTLTLCHDPILKPIRADKRQLEQVLMNLVVNARDAMPEGGEIRIITECIQLAEPLTRDRVTVPAGDYLTVEVSDKGTGIPPDKLGKVFEPFFTTKKTGDGTGLGLSTAYGIVKQTGGFIFVDSIVGTGTVFRLYFPVLDIMPSKKSLPRRTSSPPVISHEEGVILLVEDEAPVRAFASRALRLRGFTVLEADSAEAALRTLEDPSLSIDVFVTDVVMPGMDGPTWVRQALKKRPEVRVVFVSGYAEDSFGEEQKKIPNSVFLPKPFSLNDLTETVQRQLHYK
jgi:two-component system cell cycle sensor histidine kinase/response regulator CckA